MSLKKKNISQNQKHSLKKPKLMKAAVGIGTAVLGATAYAATSRLKNHFFSGITQQERNIFFEIKKKLEDDISMDVDFVDINNIYKLLIKDKNDELMSRHDKEDLIHTVSSMEVKLLNQIKKKK